MSNIALRRLNYEYKNIIKNPIDDIQAHPDKDNIFNWYFLIKSSHEPYKDGEYLGKLEFPEEYPMKPPGIKMLTPSGRFKTDTKLSQAHAPCHAPCTITNVLLILSP